MTLSPKRKIWKTSRFTRDVKKLPTPLQKEAFITAQQLADDTFHPELRVRQMTGDFSAFKTGLFYCALSFGDLNLH